MVDPNPSKPPPTEERPATRVRNRVSVVIGLPLFLLSLVIAFCGTCFPLYVGGAYLMGDDQNDVAAMGIALGSAVVGIFVTSVVGRYVWDYLRGDPGGNRTDTTAR